jgi:signal transduction histidine kinase
VRLRGISTGITLACTAVVMASVVTLALTWREVHGALESNRIAGELSSAMSQRRFLLVDYLIHGGERTRQQWAQVDLNVELLLAEGLSLGLREADAIEAMRDRNAMARQSFLRVVRGRSERPEAGVTSLRERQAMTELMTFSQLNVEEVSRFARASDLRLYELIRRAAVVFALALVALAATALAGVLLLRRRVIGPLESVLAGITVVAGGNLSFRLGEARADEIGDVSRAFDAMTARVERTLGDLRRATGQLEAANRELEAFSYSASHDLRAPLQTIEGFSLALEEDYGGNLPGEAKDYLRRVRAAAKRMAQLIDDLLKLSRVSRAELTLEPVDLADLARDAVADLRERDPARIVDVDVAPEASAWGDRRLLRVMLENLLGNAWKFTGTRAGARIAFGSRREAGETVFFVRDNGAGFDMAHKDKLFMPFQRLHGASQFPGTGIGLATVRRILQRHGGRCWAEGEVGKGASFEFVLPGPPAPAADGA